MFSQRLEPEKLALGGTIASHWARCSVNKMNLANITLVDPALKNQIITIVQMTDLKNKHDSEMKGGSGRAGSCYDLCWVLYNHIHFIRLAPQKR